MRASKIITVLLLAIGLMMILITCSGTGSTDETATDEIRTVTGTVPAANASINSLMTRQAAECAADTVMATDTAGETTSATVGADRFSPPIAASSCRASWPPRTALS